MFVQIHCDIKFDTEIVIVLWSILLLLLVVLVGISAEHILQYHCNIIIITKISLKEGNQ